MPRFKICASFPNESNWDRRSWCDTSDIPAQAVINKKEIKKEYYQLTKLKPEHLDGLRYDKVPVNTTKGIYFAHRYPEQDIQRRAWEVYGGPCGLNARKNQGLSFRSKWLSDSAAELYMAACMPERQNNEITYGDRDPASSTTPSSAVVPKSELKRFGVTAEIFNEESHVSTSSTRTPGSHPLTNKSTLKTPGTSSRWSNSSRLDNTITDLGIIEIPDEESPSLTVTPFQSSWHHSSSPTMVGSSPFMGSGKKRYRRDADVIVVSSSDEADEDALSVKKKRLD